MNKRKVERLSRRAAAGDLSAAKELVRELASRAGTGSTTVGLRTPLGAGVVIVRFRHPAGWTPEQVIQAARAAIADFLESEAGEERVSENRGSFNWGDAVEIPAEHWDDHGLVVEEVVASDAEVEHDEQLTGKTRAWHLTNVQWDTSDAGTDETPPDSLLIEAPTDLEGDMLIEFLSDEASNRTGFSVLDFDFEAASMTESDQDDFESSHDEDCPGRYGGPCYCGGDKDEE